MSDGDICFLCCGATDTLEIADVPDVWDRPHVQDLSAVAPWADVVGCPLFSVWQVVTASGHRDGFQLEFGPAESPRRIQIDGAASIIRCFDVRQVERPSTGSIMTCTVEAHVFAKYELQARCVLATLEEGRKPDLEVASNSLGTDIEWLLCDLFRLDEATARYWVDGVIIDTASSSPGRVLVLRGRAWCADHREQWQVPTEIACRFSDDREPILELLTIRIGNAAVKTLAAHRNRSIAKTANLRDWLIAFDVYSNESAG